ncbi:MAG: hypothetical protein IJ677_02830, partial [Alphaproteobacteria bacterium]|nr:hypothetical protein [Alphaproteobacteria bacterium]
MYIQKTTFTGGFCVGELGGITSLRFVHSAHRFQRPAYLRLPFACSQTRFSAGSNPHLTKFTNKKNHLYRWL